MPKFKLILQDSTTNNFFRHQNKVIFFNESMVNGLLFTATLFSISRNLSTYLYKNMWSKFLIPDFEGLKSELGEKFLLVVWGDLN